MDKIRALMSMGGVQSRGDVERTVRDTVDARARIKASQNPFDKEIAKHLDHIGP